MKTSSNWARGVLSLLLLAGCDDIRLGDITPPHATLTRDAVEPPGGHCAHGGHVVFAGPDMDGDGYLSEGEVATARYVCDNAPPAVLLRTREEPVGARCLHGGRAVETGLDTNANGALDGAEVVATEYVCGTAVPGVLVRTAPVPKGAKCPHGGLVSQAGSDTNGDGLLADSEITREVTGCREPEPVVSRLAQLGSRPELCSLRQVYAMEAGVDLDLDGALDDDEVRAVSRVCNPMAALLRRHREEPPGIHCGAGGVAVVVGGDLNGDNELQDTEVLGTAYVCQPSATFDGDYELRDFSDAAALQAISRIRGDLIVSSPELRELILPGLESVEGSLILQDNAVLTKVAMPSLHFVRGDLTLADNPRLTNVTLGPTNSLGYPLWVGGSLRIESNDALTDLTGLNAAPRRSITLRNNNQLTAPGGFPFVESLQGDLVIDSNELLAELPLFPNLLAVDGTLNISGNPVLGTLTGVKTLQRVNGDFTLAHNPLLTGVPELAKLQSVGDRITVLENKTLRTFSLPALSRALTGIQVEENLQLEEVGPFGGTLTVGEFMVYENPELLRISGLGSPLNISGELSIVGSKKLGSLSAFSEVTSVRALTVEYCDALTSLEGMHHITAMQSLTVRKNPGLTALRLDALTNVSSDFRVMFNNALPACQVIAMAEAVHTGPLDQRYTRNNYEGAICEPPP
ncbi:DUF7151 family protein [Myxococcus stipitatus]|uniref:DUF7151 family protein n=1 Tax=Myxococcus stipitatus TaxID=83455 RepID=UPI0030CB0343